MHYFHDFKSFGEASINLMLPVTLLIGRNGAGKSNAIEGVEMLAQLAHGRPLFELVDVGRGSSGGFEIRGGLDGCVRKDAGEATFELGFDARIKFDGEWQAVSYRVTIGAGISAARFVRENLLVGSRQIFSAQLGNGGDILDVTYDNFARGGTKPTTHLAADRSVLSRYATFAPVRDGKRPRAKDANRVVMAVEQHLNAAYVFDPHPRAMRDYARMGQANLARDGGNLSSVLYSLQNGDDASKVKLKAICDRISQLPEEPFVGFEFVTTSLNDVILALKTEDGNSVDARRLSDGTLRALAILTAIETVPEYSRIVVEELDNGIHPSRVELLIDALWESAKSRKLNVLATTHNPATLDCLDEEQLRSVVIAHVDAETGLSRLTPLSDLPRSEVLLEPGQLGGLVTKRTIERFLDSGFEEAHKQRMKSWLDSLP